MCSSPNAALMRLLSPALMSAAIAGSASLSIRSTSMNVHTFLMACTQPSTAHPHDPLTFKHSVNEW